MKSFCRDHETVDAQTDGDFVLGTATGIPPSPAPSEVYRKNQTSPPNTKCQTSEDRLLSGIETQGIFSVYPGSGFPGEATVDK